MIIKPIGEGGSTSTSSPTATGNPSFSSVPLVNSSTDPTTANKQDSGDDAAPNPLVDPPLFMLCDPAGLAVGSGGSANNSSSHFGQAGGSGGGGGGAISPHRVGGGNVENANGALSSFTSANNSTANLASASLGSVANTTSPFGLTGGPISGTVDGLGGSGLGGQFNVRSSAVGPGGSNTGSAYGSQLASPTATTSGSTAPPLMFHLQPQGQQQQQQQQPPVLHHLQPRLIGAGGMFTAQQPSNTQQFGQHQQHVPPMQQQQNQQYRQTTASFTHAPQQQQYQQQFPQQFSHSNPGPPPQHGGLFTLQQPQQQPQQQVVQQSSHSSSRSNSGTGMTLQHQMLAQFSPQAVQSGVTMPPAPLPVIASSFAPQQQQHQTTQPQRHQHQQQNSSSNKPSVAGRRLIMSDSSTSLNSQANNSTTTASTPTTGGFGVNAGGSGRKAQHTPSSAHTSASLMGISGSPNLGSGFAGGSNSRSSHPAGHSATSSLNGSTTNATTPNLGDFNCLAPPTTTPAGGKLRDPNDKGPKQCIVKFLAPQVTEQELRALFQQFGPVEYSRMIYDTGSATSKGYGFVYFYKSSDAAEAVKGLDSFELYGRYLRVGFAIPQRQPPQPINEPHAAETALELSKQSALQ